MDVHPPTENGSGGNCALIAFSLLSWIAKGAGNENSLFLNAIAHCPRPAAPSTPAKDLC